MTREFAFSEDFFELKAMLRQFCDEVSPETAVRNTMESADGVDRATWRRLGTELGVLGLAVPTEFGGDGAGLVMAAGVVEELGAALLCGPVVGTLCLAIPTLCAVSDAAVRDLHLPGLMSGARIATLALPSPRGVFDAELVEVSATGDDGGWTLSGIVDHVVDGSVADTLFVAARTADGVALFAVDATSDGVTRQPLSTMDLTRRQARVVFDQCAGALVAAEAETPEVCTRALLHAAVLLAAEQVGGAQRMLDATVAHVSSRLQFGQPIGAFQAVKHRCANMLVALEQARTATYHAAWALDDDSDDPRLAASLARVVASEAYTWISTSAIQLHGGLGFTWEGLPHLYFKRATTDALILGSVEDHVALVGNAAIDAQIAFEDGWALAGSTR
ncbi:acyl-CoA dehydrogenase (plasmid) [Mycolicibacterium madagascariense]|uniref:Acyl-CoA dehydrogenase n=1 Tax=Mycolicibacterium madagascariense TaxID=212765 RepID=A0A7I7XPV4_9MYCO|nr:acyl-CoA dehydrogenase family protein [Mycolicibacterium madagascariense]BBZ31225.1 acyl-CoA dehydrogenase [Mycolicibacterium madagascariense]